MSDDGYYLNPEDFHELERILERLARFTSIVFDQSVQHDRPDEISPDEGVGKLDL
jgi:hypothetical protein